MIKRFQEAEKFDVIELGKLRNLCHELGQVAYVFSDKTGTCAVPVLSLGHPWPSVAIHGHRHPWPLVARQVDTERDGAETAFDCRRHGHSHLFPPRKSI